MMPWNPPPVWAVGQVVTATNLNEYISENLTFLKDPPSGVVNINQVSDYTLSSASYTDIDATNLSITITTTGGVVEVGFVGYFNYSASAGRAGKIDVNVDGTRMGTDDGLLATPRATNINASLSLVVRKEGLSSGSHTIKMQWKCENAADTFTLYAGAGTANNDLHPHFWAIER